MRGGAISAAVRARRTVTLMTLDGVALLFSYLFFTVVRYWGAADTRDATSATGTAGAPSRKAGRGNTTSTTNAMTMPTSARRPRQRATATITTANARASQTNGQLRS